jgi:hypothetical protein
MSDGANPTNFWQIWLSCMCKCILLLDYFDFYFLTGKLEILKQMTSRRRSLTNLSHDHYDLTIWLSEFSSIGWLFASISFSKNTQVAHIFWLFFPCLRLCINFEQKCFFSTCILGDCFENSSGRPGSIKRAGCLLMLNDKLNSQHRKQLGGI